MVFPRPLVYQKETKVLTRCIRWGYNNKEVHLDNNEDPKADEAERLAVEIYPIWPIGGTYDDNHFARSCWLKGYRAGVASRDELLGSHKAMISILREENEKLKEALHYETLAAQRAVNLHDKCFKKYQAEKLKSQKLEEDRTWFVQLIRALDDMDTEGFLHPKAVRILEEYKNQTDNESGNEGGK